MRENEVDYNRLSVRPRLKPPPGLSLPLSLSRSLSLCLFPARQDLYQQRAI